MKSKHVRALQKRAKANGETIIIRGSNPKSRRWQSRDYNGQPTRAKPVTVKQKTFKKGPHAGLVRGEQPPNKNPKGFHTDENGVMVDDKGRAVRGDYDMQRVDKDGKRVDTNDPAFVKGMNDDVDPNANQFQHGANDDYRPDGKPGRNPDPDETYLVVDKDGNAQTLHGSDQLQQYYKDTGRGDDWPYPDYSQ